MNAPQYYSRLGKVAATQGGNLPHWSQRCATFVTFRLGDSLPAEKLARYEAERAEWISAHPDPWDNSTEAEYDERFPARFQAWLDAGYGACILRQTNVRVLVENALRHFADERYSLYAFVVMPNHVHVLFMPEEGFDSRAIVQSWKSFTAKAINKALNREGSVWQKESYDHLVRDVEEFNAIRAYIRGNSVSLAFDAYLR